MVRFKQDYNFILVFLVLLTLVIANGENPSNCQLSIQIVSSEIQLGPWQRLNKIHLDTKLKERYSKACKINRINCFKGNPKLKQRINLDQDKSILVNTSLKMQYYLRFTLTLNQIETVASHAIQIYNVDSPRYYWCEGEASSTNTSHSLRSNVLYFYEASMNIRVYNVVLSFTKYKNCIIPDLNNIFQNHPDIVKNSSFLLSYEKIDNFGIYQFSQRTSNNTPDLKFIGDVSKLLKENNYTVLTIYNPEFCLEDHTKDSGSGKILHWKKTSVNTVQTSQELCLDKNLIPVRRQCGFSLNRGPFWSNVNGTCSGKPSKLSQDLHKTLRSQINPNYGLEYLLKKLQEVPKEFSVVHVNLSIKILQKSLSNVMGLPVKSLENAMKIFDILSKLDKRILREADSFLSSVDNLLYIMHTFFDQADQITSTKYIEVKTVYLSRSKVIGWGISEDLQITSIYEIPTAQEFKKSDFQIIFYLSKDSLDQLKSLRDFNTIQLMLIHFHTDGLFNEEYIIKKGPFYVNIKRSDRLFDIPLTVWYKTQSKENATFAYWNYGLDDQRNPIKGQWKMIPSKLEENILACDLNYPSYFSVLLLKQSIQIKIDSLPRDNNNLTTPGSIYEIPNASYTFCKEDQTKDPESGIVLHWSRTKFNVVQTPKELCLDDQSIPARRLCSFNHTHGFFWSSVDGSCTRNISKVSKNLYELLVNEKPLNRSLIELNKMSQNLSSVADVEFASKILEKSINKLNFSDSIGVNTVQIFDNLIKTDQKILDKAQKTLNSTDRILNSMETFTEQIDQCLSTNNIKVNVLSLSNSNVIGWGVNENLEIQAIYINQTEDGIREMFLKENLTTACFLSKNSLEELKRLPNFNDLKLIVTFFQNNALFNDDFSSNNNGIKKQPFWVHIRGIKGSFNNTLTILQRCKSGQKTAFAYWHYGLDEEGNPGKGYWNKDFYETECNEIIIYKPKYPAYFSMLITEYSESNNMLRLLTIIGSILSLVGCLVVCVILLIKKTLRQEEGSKLFFNFLISIVSTYILFFVAEIVPEGIFCLAVALLLHYTILAQFSWTLILSYFQFNRFVILLKTNTSYFILKYSVCTWMVPLIPISINIFLDKTYKKMNSGLCYVNEDSLKYVILLPIALILTGNLIILLTIVASLLWRNKLKVGRKNVGRLVQMVIYNFFFLGLIWISGIVLFFDPKNKILLYVFNITATFQGFVVCSIFICTAKRKIVGRTLKINVRISENASLITKELNRINSLNSV